MKKIYLMISLYFLVLGNTAFAQSTCATAFYDLGSQKIPLPPLGTTAQTGPDYGCAGILTRPQWGYFLACAPGTLTPVFLHSLFSTTPFYASLVIWGPFTTLNNICNNKTLILKDAKNFWK